MDQNDTGTTDLLAARDEGALTLLYCLSGRSSVEEAQELGECLDLEATHHVHTGFTEDHHEAVRAFVDKREPEFKGR